MNEATRAQSHMQIVSRSVCNRWILHSTRQHDLHGHAADKFVSGGDRCASLILAGNDDRNAVVIRQRWLGWRGAEDASDARPFIAVGERHWQMQHDAPYRALDPDTEFQ